MEPCLVKNKIYFYLILVTLCLWRSHVFAEPIAGQIAQVQIAEGRELNKLKKYLDLTFENQYLKELKCPSYLIHSPENGRYVIASYTGPYVVVWDLDRLWDYLQPIQVHRFVSSVRVSTNSMPIAASIIECWETEK